MGEPSSSAAQQVRSKARIKQLLRGLEVHLQPVIEVATGRVVAAEALARFTHEPGEGIGEAIARAHADGYGNLLEAACLRAALARRDALPQGVRLTLNVSPDVLVHPVIARSWPDDLAGVVVEVTEYRASSPDGLAEQFAQLRARGASIAVDDVGSGYAGLLRLAMLRPDFVKVDRSIVTGVASNPAQGAVLEALVAFSHRIGAAVTGEGVESITDLTTLAEFDVDFAQGWAIGRPASDLAMPGVEITSACKRIRSAVLQRRAGATVAAGDIERVHSMTSALSSAAELAELHAAVAHAAQRLAIDMIGVSVLGDDGLLREITSGGAAIDTAPYPLAEYPATRDVLEAGSIVEVHLGDRTADPAEVALLRRFGYSSLLMVPFALHGRRIGVLEFGSSAHRRWSTSDVAHALGLASQVAQALHRLS